MSDGNITATLEQVALWVYKHERAVTVLRDGAEMTVFAAYPSGFAPRDYVIHCTTASQQPGGHRSTVPLGTLVTPLPTREHSARVTAANTVVCDCGAPVVRASTAERARLEAALHSASRPRLIMDVQPLAESAARAITPVPPATAWPGIICPTFSAEEWQAIATLLNNAAGLPASERPQGVDLYRMAAAIYVETL